MRLRYLIILASFLILIPAHTFADVSKIVPPKLLKSVEGDAVGLKILDQGARGLLLVGKSLILFDSVSGSKICRYKFGTSEQPLRLDAADIDNDGLFEVVVTSVSADKLSSYIFKIKDNNFSVISRGLPYFFRVLSKAGMPILTGQASSEIASYAGRVYEFSVSGKKLKKAGKLDIPRRVGIYHFVPEDSNDWTTIWVRDKSDHLRRYEKMGRKWKTVYKTSERYKGEVNCFMSLKESIATENREEAVCVPTPPLVFKMQAGGEIRDARYVIIIDNHKFLMGGVLLKPAKPRKAYLDMMAFKEEEGLIPCRQLGPYQGWIGDYFVDGKGPMAKGKGLVAKGRAEGDAKLVILKNTSDKYMSPVKVDEIDISNLDCSEKF